MSITAYIGLGSNIGDKKGNCCKALERLKLSGRCVKMSSFYCTEPVGYREQEPFINAVVELETDLSPDILLATCNSIEEELGRSREIRWGPRSIDLDILLYGEHVVESQELTIPHRSLPVRRFVLVPLSEIAPSVVHPVLKKTAAHLLHELKDTHGVTKCDP